MNARLDLAASKTIPTVRFSRSEINYGVADQQPTNDPDDARFNDPDLIFELAKPSPSPKSPEPMSDGCSRISTSVMSKIRDMLDLEYLPSVVQARVFGAKGVWYRDDRDSNPSEDEPSVSLIDIAKSQLKVKQSAEECDPEKLTFNVVNFSRPAQTSRLHVDHLPVLLDRHVPWKAIETTARRSVNAETNKLLSALNDRHLLRLWIHSHNVFREERNRESGTFDTLGGFPMSREERAVHMIQSGFEVPTCQFLAKEIEGLAHQLLTLENQNLKIELPRSTMVSFIVYEPLSRHVLIVFQCIVGHWNLRPIFMFRTGRDTSCLFIALQRFDYRRYVAFAQKDECSCFTSALFRVV